MSRNLPPNVPPPVPLDELLAHRAWMRRMAASLARDDAEADDLAQEAWVAAIERPPRHAGSLRGWFAALLRSRHLNRRRGDARRAAREEACARPEAAPDTADVVAHAELHRRVVDAVLALDEPWRTTVLLRWFEDLPPAEIAARMHVTADTVRARSKRAVEMLRVRLDAASGGHRAAWAAPLAAWARGGPAAATSATTTAAAAHAATGGALVAGTATKTGLLVTAALLLVLAAATARVLTTGAASPPPAPPDPSAHADTARAGRHRAAPPAAASDTSPAPPAPSSSVADDLAFAGIDRDRDLHGTVVTHGVTPVPGATVRAVRRPWRAGGLQPGGAHANDADPGPETRSDADGRFVLPLAPGDVVDLDVAAAGFAPHLVWSVAAGERVVVDLERGVRLDLTVRDEAGAPIAGARVDVEETPGIHGPDLTRASAVTDADGRAPLPLFAPGRAVVVRFVAHPDFACVEGPKVDLPDEGAAACDVVLRAGRVVTGVVLDAATGAPLADAQVLPAPLVFAPVAPDGTFRIHLPAAEPRFAALAPGHVMSLVDAGDRTQVEVRLAAAATVRGRVVDAAGAPIAAACATVCTSDRSVPRDAVRADAEGRFAFVHVPHGADVGIDLFAPGHGRIVLDARTPATGALDLGDVVLPAPRAIAGRVIDAHGNPVPRTYVVLMGANDDRGRLGTAGLTVSDATFWSSRMTDDLGRFRYADLSTGTWVLRAKGPWEGEVIREVALTADADVGDVVLAPASGARVVVHVRDEAGNAVAGAVVVAASAQGGQTKAATGTDGNAVLDLPATLVWLGVEPSAADGRALRVVAKPGDVKGATSAAFVVREEAWIAGRVVDAEGDGVEGEIVCLDDGGAVAGAAWTDAQGAFRIVVPPGRAFDVEFAGGRMKSAGEGCGGGVLGVAAGREDVVVRVAKAGGLFADRSSATIACVTSDGSPVAGVPITLSDGRGEFGGTATTDAQGRAFLRDLPIRLLDVGIGSHLDAAPPWRAPLADGTCWVEPAGLLRVRPRGQTVVLTFRRARTATGRVELPAGWSFPSGIPFVAEARGRTVATARARSDLSFEVPLPLDEPGPFRLVFGARRYADSKLAEGAVDGVRPGDTGVVLVVREKRE